MRKYGLLIICVVLFSACAKRVDRYYLTDVIKHCVPYQFGNTERFIDETGKTMALTVESIKDDWRYVTDESLPGTMDDYFYFSNMQFQYRNIQLLSEDGLNGINVTIDEWRYGLNREPHIDLQLLPSGKTVTVGFDLEGNFVQLGDSIEVYDSLRIGGKMYYDVVRTQKQGYDYYTGWWLDPLQCYYNKTCGVLQVKENDKLILERLP